MEESMGNSSYTPERYSVNNQQNFQNRLTNHNRVESETPESKFSEQFHVNQGVSTQRSQSGNSYSAQSFSDR